MISYLTVGIIVGGPMLTLGLLVPAISTDPNALLKTLTKVSTSQHLYVIQVRRREDLIRKLKINDISPGVHYIPNNIFPMYRNCRAEVSNAMKVSKNILSLPMHTLITEHDIRRVIKIINAGW